jgi:uncharacterized protein (TIGR02145 family)
MSGDGVHDIDGNYYPSVIVGGKEWITEDLRTLRFNNGVQLSTSKAIGPVYNMVNFYANTPLTDTTGVFADYNNPVVYCLDDLDTLIGRHYSFNAISPYEPRNICPCGWEVPTSLFWADLFSYVNVSQDLQGDYWGFKNDKLLYDVDNLERVGVDFSVQKNGNLFDSELVQSSGQLDYGGLNSWWLPQGLWIELNSDFLFTNSMSSYIQTGKRIRCVKDTIPNNDCIYGCTAPAACNFNPNATAENGRCVYPNATCDDGDAFTISDAYNQNCECVGTPLFAGCMQSEFCNFNPYATIDNGNCWQLGNSCDDGLAHTTNDVVNENCECSGTLMN